MPLFAFDIETVPDVEAGRRLHGLEGLSDADVARAMFQLRRQETGGSEFLPHHLQRVVAISIVMRNRDTFKVWSLGEPSAPEAELVARFFDGIERYTPDLVSWNGRGFDLPVLHYRALLHGVSAPRYWETGDSDQSFRWNNYLGRFHWRHIDLMDVLSGYAGRGAPLDQVAQLLGFPGKLGMDGSRVWEAWLAGEIDAIRDYCELDALNTYLVFLRFERMRGRIDEREYHDECRLVRETLQREDKPHFRAFLAAWQPEVGG